MREQATLLNSGKPIESEEINITTPLDSLELEHQHKKVKKAKKLEKSEKIVKPGSKDKEEQPATTKQATRQAKQDKSPKEKRAKRRDDERATGGKGGPEPANGASHGGRFPQPPPRTLDSIESRLKQHAKAFDGLLSLIPAKFYYGEDKTVCRIKRPCLGYYPLM